jgi:hypothetical protein
VTLDGYIDPSERSLELEGIGFKTRAFLDQ